MMKKAFGLAVFGIVTAGLVASIALANEPNLPRREKVFARLDANSDGKLEWTEFQSVAGRRMQRMDANGDKIVTATEIDAVLQKQIERRRTRLMQSLDANKDGSVTQEELDKFAQAMFNGADADKSGALSLAEAQGFKPGPWRKSYLGTAQ
jgi:hypothetical protein